MLYLCVNSKWQNKNKINFKNFTQYKNNAQQNIFKNLHALLRSVLKCVHEHSHVFNLINNICKYCCFLKYSFKSASVHSIQLSMLFLYFLCVILEHKTRLKSLGYICSKSQKYIVWVKIIYFLFYAKNHYDINKSCSMKIFCKFPYVNI